MIIEHLKNLNICSQLHPRFSQAFEFISDLDISSLTDGRVDIDGDNLYAIIVDADGKGKSGAKLETHRKYIDIQYQALGTDCIGWAPVSGGIKGQGYDPQKDVEFYDCDSWSWISVPSGCFAIFFQEDAHAPMGGTGRQLKVVVKVKVD